MISSNMNRGFTVSSTEDVFLSPDSFRALFPQITDSNPQAIEQISDHAETLSRISKVIDVVDERQAGIFECFNEGLIKAEEIVDFYESLSSLLLSDDYRRLSLYLPFEVMPDTKWYLSGYREDLRGASEYFREAYRNAWFNLLNCHDVEANFLDGDVLELDRRNRDPTRVVKAAHLIPFLLDSKIISMDEVEHILEATTDPVLERSVGQALYYLNGVKTERNSNNAKPEDAESGETNSVSKLLVGLPAELADIRLSLEGMADSKDVTTRRAEWAQKSLIERFINQYSKEISDLLLANDNSGCIEEVLGLVEGDDLTLSRIGVESLAVAALRDHSLGNAISRNRFLVALHSLSCEVRDEDKAVTLNSVISRLANSGIILPENSFPSDSYRPSARLSANLDFLADDMLKLEAFLREAGSAGLFKAILPVVVFYGSKVKGYGGPESDTDFGVFIKPEADFSKKDKIRNAIGKAASASSLGQPLELWLEEDGSGDTNVSNPTSPQYDPYVGDEFWTHMLFNSLWVGMENDITEAQRIILPRYMQAGQAERQVDGLSARAMYLESLERDALQYRLMHDGYRRYFMESPSSGSVSELNSAGSFWDSGYRMLATKIFVNKVFLPKIK